MPGSGKRPSTDAQARGEQFRAGLESNRVIGTAIGILMANHRLAAAPAFQLLVAASQHTNRKLRDIAADVTTTGRLPLRPTLIDELLIRVTRPPREPAPADVAATPDAAAAGVVQGHR